MKNNYNTKQREIILNYLIDNKNQTITAEDIINYSTKIGEKIGKATVYRYLNNLVENNIIKKFILEDNKGSCYQYIDGKKCEDHYHLKCKNCNKIIHLDCDEFKNIQNHISKEHDFEIDSIKTVFYGLCKNCKECK